MGKKLTVLVAAVAILASFSFGKVVKKVEFFSTLEVRCQGLSFTVTPDLKHVACFSRGPGKNHYLIIDDRQYGPYRYPPSRAPKISDDGRHYAFILPDKSEGRVIYYVIHDGKRYGPYKFVREFVMSRDGARVAYFYRPLSADSRWCFAINGKVVKRLGSWMLPLSKIAPDARSYAYTVDEDTPKGRQEVVYLNGRRIGAHPDVTTPFVLSPDGKKIIYAARYKGSLNLYLNGKRLREVGWVKKCTFSPDSRHFACVYKRYDKHYVLTDTKLFGPYKDVRFASLRFSKDSAHLIFTAKIGGKWSLILDGRKVPGGFDHIDLSRTIISERGGHVLFVGVDGKGASRKYTLVKDGKVIVSGSDKIGSLALSPDGSSYAYAIHSRQLKKSILYKNGRKLGEYMGILSTVFSRDGKRLAYIAMVPSRRGFVFRVAVDGKLGLTMDSKLVIVLGKPLIKFIGPSTIRYIGIVNNKLCMIEEVF